MRILLLAIPLLLARFQDPPHPLDKPLDELTAKLLSEYLMYLASDELEGRCAGFPGNDKATQFIAERFMAAGLRPVGDLDEKGEKSYFQHFKIRRGELTTRNCVGLLEGSDPVLRKEIVVLGAHHDHVGRLGQQRAGQIGAPTKDDEIWNGADDNGSGTTALLGVVKAFGLCAARPKRSILFMTFSAEEWGLLGSRWYCDHPIFPLDKTALMINMDMVGRTDEEFAAGAYALGTVTGDAIKTTFERAAKKHGLKLKIDPDFGDGSDHISFFNKGVAIAGLGEKGPCPDYHRVTDHADRIAFPTMERIARTAATVLFDLANQTESLKRDPKYKRPVKPDTGTPRIGAYLESVEGDALKALGLGENRGAMSITGFAEGSVGQTFGLRESDILVAFNGESFGLVQPREALTANLGKVVRGEAYPLDLIRDGKSITIRLTWPMTEQETKLKGMIEEWLKSHDPALEKQIIEMGEAAELRLGKLDPETVKSILATFAMRKKIDAAIKVWGSRWFIYRDPKGNAMGWSKITVSKSKDIGEPLQLDVETTLYNESTKVHAWCARDTKLSLLHLSVESLSGRREFKTDGEDFPSDITHPHVALFLAALLPPGFQGTKFDTATGKASGRVSLEIVGPEDLRVGDKDVKTTKLLYREGRRVPAAIWVDEANLIVKMASSTGTMEACTEGEAGLQTSK